MMRVGEAHPAEPRGGVIEGAEPVDGLIRNPVGVVVGGRDGIVGRFGCSGVAAPLGRQQIGEPVQAVGMVVDQPAPVVGQGDHPRGSAVEGRHGGRRAVHGLDRAVKAAPRTDVAPPGPVVLLPLSAQVESGLEVRLAEESGAVPALFAEVGGDAGRVGRERHPSAMTPWVRGYWPVSMVERAGMHTVFWL